MQCFVLVALQRMCRRRHGRAEACQLRQLRQMPCAGSSAWFILKYKLANDGAHWLECCCCCLLQGVLYHDRMKSAELEKVRPELVALEEAFIAAHPGVPIQRVPPPAAAKTKGFGSVARR